MWQRTTTKFICFAILSLVVVAGKIFIFGLPSTNSKPFTFGRKLTSTTSDGVKSSEKALSHHFKGRLASVEESDIRKYEAEACNPPNIHEFPPDLLTQKQRFYGGVIVHLIVCLHIFCALTVVCDDYFVASLNRISSCLKIKPDVAGATFMAVGSSAPTLFISVISIFFTEGDIGLGTIVGSTIFNTLFIIALCGIATSVTLELNWYPMLRDSVMYVLSVFVLMISIADREVYWYEGMIFVITYSLYIVLMYFNQKVEAWCHRKKEHWDEKKRKKEEKKIESENKPEATLIEENDDIENNQDGGEEKGKQNGEWVMEHEERSRFEVPKGVCGKLVWGFTLPSIILFYITIPDCRLKKWKRWYLVTFTVSVLWMGLLSYILVWMVTIIGYTYGIPECVMGLTFLAAGSSLPDAIASLVVAQQGNGDMAVSNCIGSNVFDMLCLGIPWLIKTTLLSPGTTVEIRSRNIFYTSTLLLGSIVVTFLLIGCNRWRLDTRIGVVFLVMYFVFLGLATFLEALPCCQQRFGY